MTCTGCLHQDYCIHFGCPFVRKPQSHSNSNGGRTRLRPVSDPAMVGVAAFLRGRDQTTTAIANRGGKRAVQSIRIYLAAAWMDTLKDMDQATRLVSDKFGAGIKPGPRETISKFGCVPTGPNPQSMTGRKAITKSGPQSHFWIAGSGDTAAINSRVAA